LRGKAYFKPIDQYEGGTSMKTQMIKKILRLSLTVVMLAGMGYATLVLTAKPAFAQTCDCEYLEGLARDDCAPRGGFYPGFPNNCFTDETGTLWYLYMCNDGISGSQGCHP
jgi:hypothetical protein